VTVYPEALAGHLGRDVTTVCHCWRLTRKDGQVSGYTDHDRMLTVDGSAFEPDSGFSASEARDSLGFSVDTVDVEGALSSERIADADIAAGLYDGARVETFLVNWREPAQFVLIRTATIGRIVRRDDGFVAELESFTRALDQRNGRYVTRLCDAELGDARCAVLLAQPAYSGAGAVVSAGPSDTIAVSGLGGFSSGWFARGGSSASRTIASTRRPSQSSCSRRPVPRSKPAILFRSSPVATSVSAHAGKSSTMR
jgi:uncharacterized phage protein (TIGR02218 family)